MAVAAAAASAVVVVVVTIAIAVVVRVVNVTHSLICLRKHRGVAGFSPLPIFNPAV